MDWDAVGTDVLHVYLAGGGLAMLFVLSKYLILQVRGKETAGASTSQRVRAYSLAIALTMLLPAWIIYDAGNVREEDKDSEDARIPLDPPWQRFVTAVLLLVPMTLLGIHEGFRIDSKLTPSQRLALALSDDDLRRRPELMPVTDSNVPAYALCCIFNSGFAEGVRQDYVDLLIQRHGRPPQGDSEWLGRVTEDQGLWPVLYEMVAEHALLMTEDEKQIFHAGLIGEIYGQEMKRDLRTLSYRRQAES